MFKCVEQATVIENFKKIHGDIYNYSLVKYENSKKKVEIICNIHGSFLQTSNNHLNGYGCKKCGYLSSKLSKQETKEIFILKANKKHNFKYDYSKSVYRGCKIDIEIICGIHGSFLQKPYKHLDGQGCIECGKINSIEKRKTTIENFCKKASIIHNFKYEYNKSVYINSITKIEIMCDTHGSFLQTPHDHLDGHGCPTCKSSRGENKISKYLDENQISYIREYKFADCKNTKSLPFDFYLPKLNICIEFDGKQHFEIGSFGSKNDINIIENFIKLKKNDSIKDNYCTLNKIKLLRISYLEIYNIDLILKSFLTKIL